MAPALNPTDALLDEIRRDPFVLDRAMPSIAAGGLPRLYSNLDWKNTVSPWGQRIRHIGSSGTWIGQVHCALRLLWASRDDQAVGLLRAYDRSVLLFCFLRSFMRPARGRVILFGFFVSHSSRCRRAFLRRALMGTTICLTWSRRQIAHYASEFDLPETKFLFLPYKANHSAGGERFASSPGDYLFSGGNSERDYATLFEAVRGTGIRVIVSRTVDAVTAGLDVPDNVEIVEAREPDFGRLMAGARGFVVCLRKGILRGAGEASFLNAMWHRKPTLVADDVSAADYIEDGVDGYVVAAGDVPALRRRILEVWNDPERAAAMGQAGFDKVRQLYTHEHWKNRMLKLAYVVSHLHGNAHARSVGAIVNGDFPGVGG
jgi:hypothetical protein